VPKTNGVAEDLATALFGAAGRFVQPLHLDLLELHAQL
jgi:hypothetical protein